MLTEAGAALLPHAEGVIAALRDAEAALTASRAPSAGVVRMVAVGTHAGPAVAGALQRVKAALPGLDVRLQTATSAEVSAQVRSGDASLGLRYFMDRSTDLDCRELYEERRLVAAGFGVSLMPRSAIEDELAADQLARIRVDDLQVGVPIVLARRLLGPGALALQRALEGLRG